MGKNDGVEVSVTKGKNRAELFVNLRIKEEQIIKALWPALASMSTGNLKVAPGSALEFYQPEIKLEKLMKLGDTLPVGKLEIAPEETNDLVPEVNHLRYKASALQNKCESQEKLVEHYKSRTVVLKAEIDDATQENEKLRTALLDYKCFNCDGCYVDMSRCTRGEEHCAEAEHNTMVRAGLAIDEKV